MNACVERIARRLIDRNCSRGWRERAYLFAMSVSLSLSFSTLEPAYSQPAATETGQLSEADEEKIINAIVVLTETEGIGEQMSMRVHPAGRAHVADDWAAAIRTLTEIGPPAVPWLIDSLDEEHRDHAISKLAFALRAIGDRRAVPALIRAIPRTLLPSRSDFGLQIEDPELLKFMQQHDLSKEDRKNRFSYGRAFREVVGALHTLTGVNQDDMELNWVHLGETETQRRIQRRQFHQLAERWADWWSRNWHRLGVTAEFTEVNLPPLVEAPAEDAAATTLPSGDRIGLSGLRSGSIIQSAHESAKRCFVDLDTWRQTGWPKQLPPIQELGANSEQIREWAQSQGFDLMGITHQPPGYNAPVYCLQPFDVRIWQITPEELRDLPRAMKGEIPYPLERPVEVLVPNKDAHTGADKHELGGTAFLFLTRDGTAGLLRMTAQVTDTNVQIGKPSSPDDQFSPVGFHRGVKVSSAIIAETGADDREAQFGARSPQASLSFTLPKASPDPNRFNGSVERSTGQNLPDSSTAQNEGKASGGLAADAEAPDDEKEPGSQMLRDIRAASAPILDTMAKDHGYGLEPDQDLRRVAPPFPPIRMEYYRTGHPTQSEAIKDGPSAMVFRWSDGKLRNWGMTFGGSTDDGYSLTSVLDALLDIKSQQIDGPHELLGTRLSGDWVIREGAAQDAVIKQLQDVLQNEFSLPVKLEFREVEREVYVARGEYELTPLPGQEGKGKLILTDETITTDEIQIFGTDLVPNSGAGGGTGEFEEFLGWLGRWIGTPIVSEVDLKPTNQVSWHLHERSPSTEQTRSEDHDAILVLGNITLQTGLTFTLEKRPVRILFVERVQ